MNAYLEKVALTARLLGLARHPLNPQARKALESAVREAKFKGINLRIEKALMRTPLPKVIESGTKWVFFPGSKRMDPIRGYVSRQAGKKSMQIAADNPEMIPLLMPGTLVPAHVPGVVPGYLVGKSLLYKALNIPTPSHMRHMKLRKEIAEGIATGAGAAGLTAAGVGAHYKVKKHQERKKRREYREEQQAQEYNLPSKPIRDKMYESLGSELEKIAESRSRMKRVMKPVKVKKFHKPVKFKRTHKPWKHLRAKNVGEGSKS